MNIYERLMSRMNWHEDCLRLGITNLVDHQTINVDQATMTLNPPYLIVMAFEDVNSAVRWHDLIASWNIGGQIVPRYNPEQFPCMRPTILVEGDFDHAELMRCVRLELGVGWTPPHVDAGPIVASEVVRRCLYAQTIMHLKSLIPAMPVDQPQALCLLDTSSEDVSLGVHDDIIPLAPGVAALDVAAFAARVPLVRWDKLDDFIRTCGEPPTVTHEVPVLR